MSVQTFEPTAAHAGVRMTPSAASHVRRQLDRAGAHAVRVSVNRSGCSGYMYQIDYVTEPRAEDREFKVAENLSVFVDTEALPLMQGTEIDLVVEGLNSTLKFRNPNAQMECGCGESFGV
ncbi:MAG: iron-sulfur cluster assembly accessory protein [Gammaproteobacteria bacterium]|jgi:iron-sulfur cluster assembly accessory protein|nr:iron-sulfur cluster assembly accessory protein [Gammaproteobacteria bacterium]MBK8134036.1 iron-sulfur cluster assembly accessory protein [Gammaproteobacteria bacterium]MBK9426881.1 iron-sulfur cluster assembly accessory protein [Gammaproteobacteria bacterium]